jgi:hypothetical protein
MGRIGCPETSVNKYQSTPHNIPEERRSHLHRGGSLKSCISCNVPVKIEKENHGNHRVISHSMKNFGIMEIIHVRTNVILTS